MLQFQCWYKQSYGCGRHNNANVVAAYILVVDKASTIEVIFMQMGQFIYQILIDIITHVYNYVHGTDYHKMIKEGEGKKKKSLTRRQSLGLHKVSWIVREETQHWHCNFGCQKKKIHEQKWPTYPLLTIGWPNYLGVWITYTSRK